MVVGGSYITRDFQGSNICRRKDKKGNRKKEPEGDYDSSDHAQEQRDKTLENAAQTNARLPHALKVKPVTFRE